MKLKKPYTQYEGRLFKFGDREICLMTKFVKYYVDSHGPGLFFEHYSFGLNDPSNRWYKTTDAFAEQWTTRVITPDEQEQLVRIVFGWKLEHT